VLEVWFSTEHFCQATIFAADPRSDLAVLRLDFRDQSAKPPRLRPIAWSTAAPVRKGQFVVSLGNPYWIARDGSASASWGIVSNVVRRPALLNWTLGGPPTLVSLGVGLQLEQRLPIGASGSPVINLRGELVGIASSLAAIEGYERSGGFAFPVDSSTRWILESLLAGYEVEYGFLGLSPQKAFLSGALAERYGQVAAARVNKVPAGSPAHLAGVRDGDLILSIEGTPIRSDLDLMRQATLYPPETVVQLLVHRSSGELTLKVKLGKWPHLDPEGVVATERRYPPWRGLLVDYPTVQQRKDQDQMQEVPAAVVITQVLPESPAQAARLERFEYITHVNKTPVRTPGEFAEAVKSLKGDVTLRLRALDVAARLSDQRDRTVVIKDKSASGTP
jgi:serine protease Do